jgi:hypothetical protein
MILGLLSLSLSPPLPLSRSLAIPNYLPFLFYNFQIGVNFLQSAVSGSDGVFPILLQHD